MLGSNREMTRDTTAAAIGNPSTSRLCLARTIARSSRLISSSADSAGSFIRLSTGAKDLDRRRAESELIEDLRPVFQASQEGRFIQLLRNDDRVARHDARSAQAGEDEAAVPAADDRAVGAQQVGAAGVGIARRPAGERQIIRNALLGVVH